MRRITTTVLGLGIDVSKKKADVCIKNQEIVERFTIPNDENGISQILQRVEPYREEFLIKAAIESTGNLWINIYDRLAKSGIEISLANPLKTRAIAEAKIKSDKVDCTILADLARADLISKCYVADKDTRDARALIRYRIDLAQRNTQLKNKIHNILDKYQLRYDGVLFSKKGLEWLAYQRLSTVDRQLVDSYLKERTAVDELIQNVQKQMAQLALHDKRVDLLLGFTGIDYYGALLLLYEIGDVTRFANPKKLVSWTGLAPSLHQSGNVRYTGRITRQGNKRIRWFLTEAAQHAAQHDPKLSIFYQRVASKKGHQKAIVAVARKLLVSIYHVLTRGELYDGNREDLRQRKLKRLERLTR